MPVNAEPPPIRNSFTLRISNPKLADETDIHGAENPTTACRIDPAGAAVEYRMQPTFIIGGRFHIYARVPLLACPAVNFLRLSTLHRPPSLFILHPSSFILHPSSFILHPSSFILHPSSFILHPSFFPSASSVPSVVDHSLLPPPASRLWPMPVQQSPFFMRTLSGQNHPKTTENHRN